MAASEGEGGSGARSSSEPPRHRKRVGSVDTYDVAAAMQFNLLTCLGLREGHSLLDIGCGSLRAGKLFLPYLGPGRYFGIEPDQSLIDDGIREEVGRDLIGIKRPTFRNDSLFRLTAFGRKFDFLLAHSIFSHAALRQIEVCLSEAVQVMEPSAVFAATFVRGEADYDGEDWVYPDFVRYTLDRIVELGKAHGLLCRPLEWPSPEEQSWVLFSRVDRRGEGDATDQAVPLWNLREEFLRTREQLRRLREYPVVRWGIAVRRLLLRLAFWRRR